MVFHDREAVLNLLRLALPLDLTTDISLNIRAQRRLRAASSVWSKSLRQLVELKKLWQPLIGGKVQATPIARAHGILRMFNRAADPFPHPRVGQVYACTPSNDWFARFDRQRKLTA